MKTDLSGEVLWIKDIYLFGFSFKLLNLEETPDQGFICCGTHGNSNPKNLLVKLDANGEVEWKETYGGTGSYFNQFVSVHNSFINGYVACGYQTLSGTTHMIVIHADSMGFIERNLTQLNETESSGITKVFPNPAREIIFLYLDHDPDSAEIFTLNGKKVNSYILHKGQNQLNIHELKPGIYILQTSSGKDLHFTKFVKQ
jgi:hypothetical protein